MSAPLDASNADYCTMMFTADVQLSSFRVECEHAYWRSISFDLAKKHGIESQPIEQPLSFDATNGWSARLDWPLSGAALKANAAAMQARVKP